MQHLEGVNIGLSNFKEGSIPSPKYLGKYRNFRQAYHLSR